MLEQQATATLGAVRVNGLSFGRLDARGHGRGNLRGKGDNARTGRPLGDVNVLGPRPDDDPWEIGIRRPRLPGAFLGNVEIHRGALAISDDYERFIITDGVCYGHILNTATGWPTRGLASFTVLA